MRIRMKARWIFPGLMVLGSALILLAGKVTEQEPILPAGFWVAGAALLLVGLLGTLDATIGG